MNDSNNNLIDLNSFVRICHYLPTGMILRCGAVCKKWAELCKSDDVWITILGIELHEEVGLSKQKNIRLNRQIAIIWKDEFAEKHKGSSVKEVYMKLRRDKIKWTERSQPGYKNKMRIFPVTERSNALMKRGSGVPGISGTLVNPSDLLKFLNDIS